MVPVDLRRVLGKREPHAVGHPPTGQELRWSPSCLRPRRCAPGPAARVWRRVRPGEVTERPNVAVLKTAVRLAHRGFESLPLRHVMLTRTLGSRCAAEGLLVLGRGRSRGSQPHRGAMYEGRDLLDEGWVYSVGCGGSCSTHNPQASTARGSWSSRPGRGRLRPWKRWRVCGVVGPLTSWDCAGPGRLWWARGRPPD